MKRCHQKSFDLIKKIQEHTPHMAQEVILPWTREMADLRYCPFVKKHYWNGRGSINVFRIVGTQDFDYAGKTWLWLLQNGKRMDQNLRLYKENPGYYLAVEPKEPKMIFNSLDGVDWYVGDDCNHRSCIARFDFCYRDITTLHGVELNSYTIDWRLKDNFDRLCSLISERCLPYLLSPVQEYIGRDDAAGYMLDTYVTTIVLKDLQNNQEHLLDNRAAEAFYFDILNNSTSIFTMIKRLLVRGSRIMRDDAKTTKPVI